MTTFSAKQISTYLAEHNNRISLHFFESPAFSHVMDSMGVKPSITITKGRKPTNDPLAILTATPPQNYMERTHVYITTHDLRRSLQQFVGEIEKDHVLVVRKGTLHDPKQTVAYVTKPSGPI